LEKSGTPTFRPGGLSPGHSETIRGTSRGTRSVADHARDGLRPATAEKSGTEKSGTPTFRPRGTVTRPFGNHPGSLPGIRFVADHARDGLRPAAGEIGDTHFLSPGKSGRKSGTPTFEKSGTPTFRPKGSVTRPFGNHPGSLPGQPIRRRPHSRWAAPGHSRGPAPARMQTRNLGHPLSRNLGRNLGHPLFAPGGLSPGHSETIRGVSRGSRFIADHACDGLRPATPAGRRRPPSG
jgi:hypothetical protein